MRDISILKDCKKSFTPFKFQLQIGTLKHVTVNIFPTSVQKTSAIDKSLFAYTIFDIPYNDSIYNVFYSANINQDTCMICVRRL